MAGSRRRCDPCDPRPTRRRCPDPEPNPGPVPNWCQMICDFKLPRCLWIILIILGVLLALILLFQGFRKCEPLENYACYGIGARLEPLCPKTLTCPPKGCSQLLGFNFFCDESYSPLNILKVGKEGWCLEGDNANIMVRLSQPSLVREIWMASGSNYHSSGNVFADTIRIFEITGFDGNQRSIFVQKLKMERWGGLQKFKISQHTETCPRVEYIQLEVKSNYGAPETFLNRFMVMAVSQDTKFNGNCPK